MEAENKKRLEDLIEAISGFINSPVHVAFVGSTKRELEAVTESILDNDPFDDKLDRQIAYLQGQRTVLKSNLSLFEDTVENLKARILAIQDEEQPIPHSNNQEEYDEI